jgi:hypothetical protein
MKRCLFCAVLGISLCVLPALGQSYELFDLYNSATECDYLILTPRVYADGAQRLATLRNTSSRDDVGHARYLNIENLFATQSGAPDTIIRRAVQWAVAQWRMPPAYLVLIGDDSVAFTLTDTSFQQQGPMPTHVFNPSIQESVVPGRDTIRRVVAQYSDDWYATKDSLDSDASDLLAVAVGRIPCETATDLDTYLDKLERYDGLANLDWRRNILMLTDDFYQDSFPDPIDHEQSAERIINLLATRQVERLYLNNYSLDANRRHTAAKQAFFTQINRGYGWVIYFGHGHSSKLADENFLEAADYTRFGNLSAPTIFFSLSCSNGAFLEPADSSMCKRFLFADKGGTIAYIANPNLAYGFTNERFMLEICKTRLADSAASIGKLVVVAKQKGINRWESGLSYDVFGDPAIRDPAVYSRLLPVKLSARENSDASISCSVNDNAFASGRCSWRAIRVDPWQGLDSRDHPRDTVLACGDMQVSNSFTLNLPDQVLGDSVNLEISAWNESVEADTVIVLGLGRFGGINPNAMRSASSGSFHVRAGSGRQVTFEFGDILRRQVTIAIYDLKGRSIHSIVMPAGVNRTTWDSRGNGGALKAGGTYCARVHGSAQTCKSVLFHVW